MKCRKQRGCSGQLGTSLARWQTPTRSQGGISRPAQKATSLLPYPVWGEPPACPCRLRKGGGCFSWAPVSQTFEAALARSGKPTDHGGEMKMQLRPGLAHTGHAQGLCCGTRCCQPAIPVTGEQPEALSTPSGIGIGTESDIVLQGHERKG